MLPACAGVAVGVFEAARVGKGPMVLAHGHETAVDSWRYGRDPDPPQTGEGGGTGC